MDNNLSFADFAAMTGNKGNEGVNAMWNNPFMYLIWLAWFGGGNGFGFGGNRAGVAAGDVQAANNAAAIQNLSDMIQDNHNSDLTMQAIAGNTNAINQLAGMLNVSTDKIAGAVNIMASQMMPKAPWSREQWRLAMEQHGYKLEHEPQYNKCALWVAMNMIMSDSSETLRKYVANDKLFGAVYELAVDKLTDADGKFRVRKYFSV